MDELTNVIIENENLIYSIINKYSNYYDLDDCIRIGISKRSKKHKTRKSPAAQ